MPTHYRWIRGFSYLFIGVSNFRYGEYLFVKKKRLAKKSITGSSVCKYVEKYECF